MRAFKSTALSIVTVALAALVAILGWKLDQANAALRVKNAEIQSMRMQVARAEHTKERVLAKFQGRDDWQPAGPAPPRPVQASSARSKLQTWSWLHDRHLFLHVVPIDHLGGHLGLDPKLAVMLGLTPAEFDHLNAAIQKTERKFAELAIQKAVSHVSANGKTLTVAVPPLARAGDALYANLLNTFENVLGPQRFQLFNAVAGDSFDNSFGGFGVDPVTYVLTLQPTGNDGGTPRYSVTRSFTQTGQNGVGWSRGSYSRKNLEENFPVLAHFLPPQ